MSAGYVYVLSNPSMPGIVKVGRSIKGGAHRSKAFFQTGVAEPYVLEFEIFTEEHEFVERETHKILNYIRVNPKREFFKTSPADAIETIVKIYMAQIYYGDAKVVDSFMHDLAVDVLGLSHKLDMPAVDVADCLLHLDKDAVLKALAKSKIKNPIPWEICPSTNRFISLVAK